MTIKLDDKDLDYEDIEEDEDELYEEGDDWNAQRPESFQ